MTIAVLASQIADEKLAELRAQHGPTVEELFAHEQHVYAKRPDRGAYKKFRAKSVNENTRADALEQLTRECIVHPTGADLMALFDAYPALADVFGAKVLESAGLTGEAEAKKR